MLINDWLPEWSPSDRRKHIWGLSLDGRHGAHCQWDSVLVKLARHAQLQCGLSSSLIT